MRVTPSLSLKITVLISGILLLACLITTSFSYFTMKSSIKEIFDNQQLLFAKRLASLSHQGSFIANESTPEELASIQNSNDNALAFAIFDPDGEMIISDGEDGKKFVFEGGFFDLDDHQARLTQQDDWSLLWLVSLDGYGIIAVGQKLDYQKEILTEFLYKQLQPWFITFFIVILFSALIITRSFKPITALAKKLERRKPDDETPINPNLVPKEVRPFISALNALFTRISMMIHKERQFISDAAHELRTPLAAIKVQAEVAELSKDEPEVRDRAISKMILSIDRATHLVDQLLTLSRIDSFEIKTQITRVHLNQLTEQVIEELQEFADKKAITIVTHFNSENEVKGNPDLLIILIKNLIKNAINYIPEQGTITVTINHNQMIFEDNGPGVSQEILERLGERFYRPAGQTIKGSGLGLSIVKKIAELHQIEVKFANGLNGGFQVTLNFKSSINLSDTSQIS